jgi:hypothetical protein
LDPEKKAAAPGVTEEIIPHRLDDVQADVVIDL